MTQDINAIVDLISRAMYVYVAAFMSGAFAEGSTRLSSDAAKAQNQVNWRWSEACRQLYSRSVMYEPANVDRVLLLPSCRRLRLATTMPQLLRFIEVVDRLRVPLLEVLATDELETLCTTSEGVALGHDLLSALVSYDVPTLVRLADEVPELRDGLVDVLRVTRNEFAAMRAIDAEQWASVGQGERWFGRFDINRRSN